MQTVTYGKDYLEATLNETINEGKKIFIPYIMAGDGGLDSFIPTLQKLDEAGATAIEVGIPFSDPVADGPTIQQAGKRAQDHGVTLPHIIDILKEERTKIQAPIIFMTYINPIYKYGVDQFMLDAKVAGVDGLIIPDLPLEQTNLIEKAREQANIAQIQLVSLTSSKERMKKIAAASQGFLYAVTVNGITGARQSFDDSLSEHFQHLKSVSSVPVLAGFGVSTPDHVKQLTQYSDGVIVGSKIINLLHEQNDKELKELIKAKD
ncbi:tryptophan synthase subunit alpha [Alkalibacillus haloalkaliphilus]|uniref:tryptophan synthase subunit alpha n=1 Tax=Alkalibacillus haloalkaliphilus TaxID=94136 RepID=UPI0029354A43|nr:tryptophan synthase subunit alpha [Alkalibacillus haloalkaliphilus]MDV2582984.1 tryptophan synthase subunit alpha [Alkalibacillus haloalkaliphilus]